MGTTENLTTAVSGMANSYMQRQMLSNVMNVFTGKSSAAPASTAGANDPRNII